MEAVKASLVPVSPDLIWMMLIQQAMVFVAWVIGLAVHRGPRNRMTMSMALTTLTGLAGLWGGLLLTGWISGLGDL